MSHYINLLILPFGCVAQKYPIWEKNHYQKLEYNHENWKNSHVDCNIHNGNDCSSKIMRHSGECGKQSLPSCRCKKRQSTKSIPVGDTPSEAAYATIVTGSFIPAS